MGGLPQLVTETGKGSWQSRQEGAVSMKVTLTASSGAQVVIWRRGDMFHARRADAASAPEICLALDLFEVIAELGGLDLEHEHQAAEAQALSDEAQRRLHSTGQAGAAADEQFGREQRRDGA